ncbi:GlxA family transcriptional regulator [Coralliovum pocilloporae]|uniref:GlxA family transcriptional regulator n=1 Tax=Coralliovum pocilloporae TaxID=3066369 RepID=UPI0033072AB5
MHMAFVLFDHFSGLCLSNALEPLRAANMKSGRDLYSWSLASPDGKPAVTSSQLQINADFSIDTLPRPDILFVMPSYHYTQHETPAVLRSLRQWAQAGLTLGGLDSGSHLLARAGLLDGYRATIHWEELGIFEERFLNVTVVADRFVIDRNRITAGGGTTTLDLMLHLIRRDHGETLANDVAGTFIYDHERASGDPQWSNPGGIHAKRYPKLARALTIMSGSLEEPVAIGELARKTGMSQRDLERLFKKVLSTSPNAYYQHLRLAKARSLLMETALTVAEIAARTGYTSGSAFSRAFRSHFGHAPGKLRQMR